MNTKHVSGLTVVSVGSGERLGRVQEVMLDADARHITAFAVQSGINALIPVQEPELSWLAAEEVRAIGPDALTVDDAGCLREFGPQSEAVRVEELLKRKVVTEGGTYIGPVESLDFDERSMAITNIEISAGFFKANRMVPIDQLISVGPEFVVVTDAVSQQMDDRSETDDDLEGDDDAGRTLVVVDEEPRSGETP